MKYHKYGIFSSLALFLMLDISTCLQQYILSLSEVGYFYHILLKYILKSKKMFGIIWEIQTYILYILNCLATNNRYVRYFYILL